MAGAGRHRGGRGGGGGAEVSAVGRAAPQAQEGQALLLLGGELGLLVAGGEVPLEHWERRHAVGGGGGGGGGAGADAQEAAVRRVAV